MKFPADVEGWLTPAEGQFLAQIATDKRVLEIGSYCGRSTICLAQTAQEVHAVDPFDGRATPNRKDTFGAFSENLERYGVADRVTAHRGTSIAVLPKLQPESFDLVWIDGAHAYESVLLDIWLALKVLKPGGLLAFHDYRSPRDPGVTAAVNKLLAVGGKLLSSADTVALVDPKGVYPDDIKPKPAWVVLGMPHYGPVHMAAAKAFWHCASAGCHVQHVTCEASLLANGFNSLLGAALSLRESGYKFFVMLHGDIVPEPFWVDMLLAELMRLNADLVSAVVPIKDGRGLTSTGIDDAKDPWTPLKRLTLKEVHRLPETFNAEDAGFPHHRLLVNTGCWIMRLDTHYADRVRFTIRDQLLKDGQAYKPQVIPEDWDFSRQVQAAGGKVYATRKVRLAHLGGAHYRNDQPWGAWDHDEAYAHKLV